MDYKSDLFTAAEERGNEAMAWTHDDDVRGAFTVGRLRSPRDVTPSAEDRRAADEAERRRRMRGAA